MTDDSMSMRDQFAIAALQSIVAATLQNKRLFDLYDGIQGGMIEATAAYVLADAMLKARKARSTEGSD